MSKIEQLLDCSYDQDTQTAWSNINPSLRAAIDNIYRSTDWNYYICQSRSLRNIIHDTIASYYRNGTNPYKFLAGICSLVTGNKPINFVPKYRLITSEEATTLTLNELITDIGSLNTDKTHICIYHIPKGKSYLRKLLDTNPTLQRIPQIETFCISNPYHFIRIYKGFGQTNPNDITIFTDQITKELMHTIFIMLPNLLDIQLIDTKDGDFIPPEVTEHNNKVTLLRELFSYLYTIYQDHSTQRLEMPEIEVIKANIFRITTQFAAQFDFTSKQLGSFAARLAKARNDNASRHYETELKNINERISGLEDELTTKYERKHTIQRLIAANRLLTEDDIKPFMDTIVNSKAIEILYTSDTELKLKVTAPFQFFTPEDFDCYERNPNSIYNTNYRNLPEYKSILHKIFNTREYQLIAQSIITIKINTHFERNPLQLSAQQYNLQDFTQFPNPHLYHYNCWESARNEMNKNMCEGNFELVIMQMIAATQSVNIAEQASFVNGLLSDFKNDKINHLITIVDTNTKKTYSLKEAIKQEKNLKELALEAEKAKILEHAQEVLNNPTQNTGYRQVVLPEEFWTPEDEEE